MLTEFSFDNNFLDSKVFSSKAALYSFLECWRLYGVLIISKDYGLDKINKEIKSRFSPKLVQDFNLALQYYPVVTSEEAWPDFLSFEHYDDLKKLEILFKVGFFNEEKENEVESIPGYVKYCNKTGFEIIGLDNFNDSINLNNSKVECRADIQKNSCYKKNWERKFDKLAEHCKKIVIIDRYLFKNVFENYPSGNVGEVDRLFQLLSGYNKKFSFEIYSQEGNYNKFKSVIYDKFEADIWERYRKNINKIDLYSCNNCFFSSFSHDRFLAFDDYVCTIGVGLDIFKDAHVPMTSFLISRDNKDFLEMRRKAAVKKGNLAWSENF